MLEYCQQRDVGRGSSVGANRTLSYSRKRKIVGCLKENLFTLGLAIFTFDNGYGFVGEAYSSKQSAIYQRYQS